MLRVLSLSPLLSPLMPKSCAGHNSPHWDNLIILGRDIYEVKKVCSMQGELLLCWLYTPINIHLYLYKAFNFAIISEYKCIYIPKFKVFANIVSPVQIITSEVAGLSGSVGCAIRLEIGGRGFNPHRGRQHSFVEIDHEIYSMVILSLPLIQEGQLSVSGEWMCTILVNRLED